MTWFTKALLAGASKKDRSNFIRARRFRKTKKYKSVLSDVAKKKGTDKWSAMLTTKGL